MSEASKGLSGCALIVWQFFVGLPLWFSIIYGLMSAVQPPQWVWICFFIYIPVQLVGFALSSVFHLADA